MGKRKVDHPLPPPKKRGTQMTISELPPEMLDQVLRHLSMDDLKNTRLVNKTWSQVAVAPMRQKSRDVSFLAVDRGEKLDDLYDDLSRCLKKGDDFPLDKFFIYLYLLSKIDKHKTYETRSRSSALVPKKNELTLDSLLEKISPFVKELFLGLVGSGNANKLKAENLPKKRDYPKLKSLRVFMQWWSQTEHRRSSELWNGYMDFVRKIVEGAPKLENITLEIGGGENHKTVVVQFITDVFPNGRKINLLTKIDVITVTNPPFDYFDWTALTTMGLKLRELELNLSRLVLSNDLLRTFLESQSKSLMNLKLGLDASDWFSGVPGKFKLPQLEKLEILELEDYFYNFKWDDNEVLINFPDINYQNRLPSLKKLVLCKNTDWQDFLKEGLAPSETLEELRLSTIDPKELKAGRADRTIVLAKEIFPNLKRLQLYDDPAMVTTVYENLPDLEELTLVFVVPRYFGQLISGLTQEECSSSSSKRLSKQTLQKLEISKANRKSLGCLQNLHTLRIRGVNELTDGRGTRGIIPLDVRDDISFIVESFSKASVAVLCAMESLKRIDFFGGATLSPINQNEKELLETLKQRFVVL